MHAAFPLDWNDERAGSIDERSTFAYNSNDINRNEMSKIERQKRIIETKRAQSFTERQTNIHIL